MDTAIDPRGCTLVLVDFQERLLPAIHLGTEVLDEALRLADCARTLGIRVVGTEQNPRGLGPSAQAIRERCDVTLPKMHFDACVDGLQDSLHAPGGKPPADIVIAGCETHVCLMQTALGLLRAGLRLRVVEPACGSRAPRDHALAIERLRAAGAVIVSREMVVFEWLGSCEHERFKSLLPLLKAPRR